MDDSMLSGGQPRCPYCGYHLTGLPTVHSCPECGFEYDPHCVLMRLGGQSRHTSNLIGGILFGAFILYGVASRDVPIKQALPCAVPLAIVVAVGLHRWFRHLGQERLLVINRAGIRFQHPDLSEAQIPWSRFGRARVSWLTGRFRIDGLDGRAVVKCRYYQLGSIIRMKACAAELNRLARVYASEPGPLP